MSKGRKRGGRRAVEADSVRAEEPQGSRPVKSGIQEILESGCFPSVVCRGDRKGRAFDDIDPKHRVMADTGGGGGVAAGKATMLGVGNRRARKREKAYQERIEMFRKAKANQKGKSLRLTHSVPAELYHGKICETGDKDFWRDPKNLNQAKSCKVD